MSLLKVAGTTASSGTLYVDDVFSTYLYTGNSTARSITNGIDLSTNGGMVWFKSRNLEGNHYQVDTARGNTKYLASNSTTSQMTFTDALTAFNTTGFNLGVDAAAGDINGTGYNMASWTFRKAAKFFDVVTFTSASSGATTFNHSLGVTPAFVILKATAVSSSWLCYHTSLGTSKYIELNSSAAQQNGTNWISVDATSVTVSSGWIGSSRPYVAYLFAHDTAADGIIQCGSFTTDGGGNATVNLGWEPQYIMAKRSDSTGYWIVLDTMRGWVNGGSITATDDKSLFPNVADAETNDARGYPTATGFTFAGSASGTFIYMAIRMPNKPPTSGTQVFSPQIWTGNATARTITGTNNPVDLSIVTVRDSSGGGGDRLWNDRLRGAYQTLYSNYTSAEATQSNYITGFDVQYGEKIGTAASVNGSSITYVAEMFSRAPRFFDVVCYTGTGVAGLTVTHNLTVAPELLIVKARNNNATWAVYSAPLGATKFLQLEATTAAGTLSAFWNNTLPTASVFTVGNAGAINDPAINCVAYLFATLAGISKVGSYTGNGSTQNINCGFAAGARFIMIKATSTTGNWIVFDSARGIVAGNDPFFYMNNQDAETTNQDAIDPYSAGFTVNTTNVNDSGVSYIFLAVA